jgi:hypothetical protein
MQQLALDTQSFEKLREGGYLYVDKTEDIPALNNPQDITLEREYATICGYTQEEPESNFSEYIDRAAEHFKITREDLLERIRYWYNGYTWDGETAVYNPFSTMNFLKRQEFDNYWFSTGTPAFLIDLIQRRDSMDSVLEPIVVDSSVFKEYDPTNVISTICEEECSSR